MRDAALFSWMGWYIGGLAIGAFLWESHTLGLILGAFAASCYFLTQWTRRRWTWEQFEAAPNGEDDER